MPEQSDGNSIDCGGAKQRNPRHLILTNPGSPNQAKQLSRSILNIDMETVDRDGNTPIKYNISLQISYRPEKREKDGNTPSLIVVKSKKFATIKLLAQCPHIHFVNDDGRSPLAAAITIGNETATNILWRHNAEPHVVDKAGNTLLLLEYAGPSVLILKHILEHYTRRSPCIM